MNNRDNQLALATICATHSLTRPVSEHLIEAVEAKEQNKLGMVMDIGTAPLNMQDVAVAGATFFVVKDFAIPALERRGVEFISSPVAQGVSLLLVPIASVYMVRGIEGVMGRWGIGRWAEYWAADRSEDAPQGLARLGDVETIDDLEAISDEVERHIQPAADALMSELASLKGRTTKLETARGKLDERVTKLEPKKAAAPKGKGQQTELQAAEG